MEKIIYDDEVWKPVVGWEGLYEVSNKGRVRSLDRYIVNDIHRKDGSIYHQEYFKQGTILKGHNNGHSYINVGLHGNGRKDKHVYIHIMVAQAFIPNPDNLPEVNHKDFNKANNTVENLEWVSRRDNQLHYRKSKRAKADLEKRDSKIASKICKKIIDNKDVILTLYKKGYSIVEIAEEVHLGRDFVTSIIQLFEALGCIDKKEENLVYNKWEGLTND